MGYTKVTSNVNTAFLYVCTQGITIVRTYNDTLLEPWMIYLYTIYTIAVISSLFSSFPLILRSFVLGSIFTFTI